MEHGVFKLPAQILGKGKAIMKKVFVSMLPIVLLCGTWSREATAQTSNTSQPSTQFAGWDVSKKDSSDLTVIGIIQQAVPNQIAGAPAGLHLMLGTPQGVLDASVGPYLAPDIKAVLVSGKQIQVSGQIQTLHDQKYLLVRQIVLDGKPIAVRNDYGSLVRTRSQERTQTQSSLNDQDGGIQ
jgi:hypothetical protein